MTSKIKASEVSVGFELTPLEISFTRADLVNYANASGDQNPIHQDEAFAKSVGLPDVISHGMLTMGRAIRLVTDWVGDPAAVIDFGVRMTRPVVVPNTPSGTIVTFAGKIIELNDDGTAHLELSAICEGTTVLGQAKATVQLAQ